MAREQWERNPMALSEGIIGSFTRIYTERSMSEAPGQALPGPLLCRAPAWLHRWADVALVIPGVTSPWNTFQNRYHLS